VAGVPQQAQGGFFVTVDKLDTIGWDGVAAELEGDRSLPAEVVAAAREKIESLTELPANKVADALADVVPGLPEQVAADLATLAGCLTEPSSRGPVPSAAATAPPRRRRSKERPGDNARSATAG
jgi:histidyl-tRNA synthetase